MLAATKQPEKLEGHQWWCERRFSNGSIVGAVLVQRGQAAPMTEIAEEAAEYFDRGHDNNVICVVVTSSFGRKETHNVRAHRSKTWMAELSGGENLP